MKRFLLKILYGNVIVIGGLYLTLVSWFFYLHFREGLLGELGTNFFEMNRGISHEISSEPGILWLLVLPGSILGLVWYVIARVIEGKRLKEASSPST